MDFNALKMQYVTTGISLRVLADKINVPIEDLESIAEQERWRDEREAFVRQVYGEALERSKDALVSIYVGSLTGAKRMTDFVMTHMTEEEIEVENPRTGRIDKKRVVITTAPMKELAVALREARETLKFAMGSPAEFLQVAEKTTKVEQTVSSIDTLRGKLRSAVPAKQLTDGGGDELGD